MLPPLPPLPPPQPLLPLPRLSLSPLPLPLLPPLQPLLSPPLLLSPLPSPRAGSCGNGCCALLFSPTVLAEGRGLRLNELSPAGRMAS